MASSARADDAAEGGYGFAEALDAAQKALDESRRVLSRSDGADPPDAAAPLHFDSRSIAVLAYKSAVERVRERFWTTTFLASGFWSSPDAEILDANLRMMANLGRTGASVQRMFLLHRPAGEEIQRLQDERMLLRKCDDLDGLQRFDRRVESLAESILRLAQHGCDVRVVHDPEQLHLRLPAELNIDPRDTEVAIYDDWRFDLFQGGMSGTIQSIRGYTPVMARFKVLRDQLIEYFESLWARSKPIADFVDRLREAVEYSSARIDYHTSWLARYDHALPREDEALKIEEMSGVRIDLVRLGRWGRIQNYVDIGTCTGRYPLALRAAVLDDGLILGVDNDMDCVRFTQSNVRRACEGDRRFLIERHDFRAPELPSTRSFDLITCMLGTICHFEWQAGHEQAPDDAFQRALEKFARMLSRNGVLFFSIWSDEACRDLRFLSIYSEEDKRRLARTAIPPRVLEDRLRMAGLRAQSPILLQDRMALYRCERI
jgi:SAM-dependent methyltransferase